MRVRCCACNNTVGTNKRTMRKEIIEYAEKRIYLCGKCRYKVILKELERLLYDKRRR